MIDIEEIMYNYCDGCSSEIPIGENCFVLIISEITGSCFPYLPELSEITCENYTENTSMDGQDNKRKYPFRTFCSLECLQNFIEKTKDKEKESF